MSKIILNIGMILFLLYGAKFKLKAPEYRPGRIIIYILCSSLSFAMIGKAFFYESIFYSIGLHIGLVSFFGTLMYFLWQGRADRNKRRAFNFGIGVLIFIVLIAIFINSNLPDILGAMLDKQAGR